MVIPSNILADLTVAGLQLELDATGENITVSPNRLLTEQRRKLILENKPGLVALLQCQDHVDTDPKPKPAPTDQKARTAFFDAALGHEPDALVTITDAQTLEAVRLGLVQPGKVDGNVVLARRLHGAQGLVLIPASRYDGLRVAEIHMAHVASLTEPTNMPTTPRPSGPSTVRCADCRHYQRTTHPHLGHCRAGEPEAAAGLWYSDHHSCRSFLQPTEIATAQAADNDRRRLGSYVAPMPVDGEAA